MVLGEAMAELVSATLSDRSAHVTMPDPATAIRDDHHDLEHFEPLLESAIL
jgi:hypothetical protein